MFNQISHIIKQLQGHDVN